MPNFRNTVATDQGVNWVVEYEWTDDGGATWNLVDDIQFPRDLDDLEPHNAEELIRELANSVSRNRGVHD